MEAARPSADDLTVCGGVTYNANGRETRVYFPNPAATLPVMMRDGSIELLPWGRRPSQAGALPLGGWARLESIHTGRWDRWFPVPVKLLVLAFMEKDIEGKARWYDLTRGKFIQGLIARERHEQRVYVVTIEPAMEDAIHDRWPRIVSGGKVIGQAGGCRPGLRGADC